MKTKNILLIDDEVPNKKYFIKILPVDGDIKDGDIITGKNEVSVIVGRKSKHGLQPWALEEIPNIIDFKKSKLFLCSKDIQVDDEVWDSLKNRKLFVKEVKGFLFGIGATVYDKDNLTHCYNTFYKIIGEVSPKAIWVKEGDEFDEEDMMFEIFIKNQIYKNYKKTEDAIIDYKNLSNSIKKHTDLKMVCKLKCPTCKSYH